MCWCVPKHIETGGCADPTIQPCCFFPPSLSQDWIPDETEDMNLQSPFSEIFVCPACLWSMSGTVSHCCAVGKHVNDSHTPCCWWLQLPKNLAASCRIMSLRGASAFLSPRIPHIPYLVFRHTALLLQVIATLFALHLGRNEIFYAITCASDIRWTSTKTSTDIFLYLAKRVALRQPTPVLFVQAFSSHLPCLAPQRFMRCSLILKSRIHCCHKVLVVKAFGMLGRKISIVTEGV